MIVYSQFIICNLKQFDHKKNLKDLTTIFKYKI